MSREFRFTDCGHLVPAAGWQLAAGFFTGQDKADLFGYRPDNGTLWVGRNTGDGFDFQPCGNVTPPGGWQFVAGDFTGNGGNIAGYDPTTGTVWVGVNTGGGFELRQWGTVTPAAGWQFAAGFFSGRAKMDLFGYQPADGTLWIGENNGARFVFRQFGTVIPRGDWQFVAGDFTGNARSDVAGYHPGNGSVWVAESTGNRLELRRWGTLDPPAGWKFAAGFFTSRARMDLVGYQAGDGTLWVGENLGPRVAFRQWAMVESAGSWDLIAGVFDADLWFDVVGYDPADGALSLGRSRFRPIDGYCWPLSVPPGDNVSFMISGHGMSSVVFSRHTSISTAVDAIVMGNRSFVATAQDVPLHASRTGCGWQETFALTVPPSWPSGIYSARCSDPGGDRAEITFVVKPDAAKRARVAVVANVNTWLAYNGWGGGSKYRGLARTSFLRPNPAARPEGESHLTRGELWVLGWLEQEGHRPDVYTDIDFHTGEVGQYPLLVLSTHPEYWTTRMYDNLKAFLDAGGCVAYLGGNGIYENAEYENGGTSMVFRAGVEGGSRADALFRVLVPARPERSLLGVATERCAVTGAAYEVVDAAHPLFAGTGLRTGDPFGEAGLNGKASGLEVDTSDGPGATTIPRACITEDRPVPPSSLPSGLIVLARARADDAGRGAEMVYYNHPGGGFVFSVGSVTFGGSLVVDARIQQIMRNVLQTAGVA
jgi:hypothetical protein